MNGQRPRGSNFAKAVPRDNCRRDRDDHHLFMLALTTFCTGFMLKPAGFIPVSRAAIITMGYSDPPEPWPRMYEGVSETMRMAYAREAKRMVSA